MNIKRNLALALTLVLTVSSLAGCGENDVSTIGDSSNITGSQDVTQNNPDNSGSNVAGNSSSTDEEYSSTVFGGDFETVDADLGCSKQVTVLLHGPYQDWDYKCAIVTPDKDTVDTEKVLGKYEYYSDDCASSTVLMSRDDLGEYDGSDYFSINVYGNDILPDRMDPDKGDYPNGGGLILDFKFGLGSYESDASFDYDANGNFGEITYEFHDVEETYSGTTTYGDVSGYFVRPLNEQYYLRMGVSFDYNPMYLAFPFGEEAISVEEQEAIIEYLKPICSDILSAYGYGSIYEATEWVRETAE